MFPFRAQDKERNEKVAIKIQPKDSDTRRMVLEHGVLLKLMGKVSSCIFIIP